MEILKNPEIQAILTDIRFINPVYNIFDSVLINEEIPDSDLIRYYASYINNITSTTVFSDIILFAMFLEIKELPKILKTLFFSRDVIKIKLMLNLCYKIK